MAKRTDVTRLLNEWGQGDPDAMERLMPLVYDELRAVAGRRLRAERADHTLQATALVNEVYLRMVGAEMDFNGRAHFIAIASRVMRRVLVDHARMRSAAKRGGNRERMSLTEANLVASSDAPEVIALHEALEALEAQDERKARVVELMVFGGATYDETAAALDISAATVDRDFRLAKAWLARYLEA